MGDPYDSGRRYSDRDGRMPAEPGGVHVDVVLLKAPYPPEASSTRALGSLIPVTRSSTLEPFRSAR